MRLIFRVAAVAALVWIARELMRRWVDGPETPTVAGSWETWQSRPPPDSPGVMPAKKAPPTKADAPTEGPEPAPAQAAHATPPERATPLVSPRPDSPPAQRRQRPLKATRIAKAEPAAGTEAATKKPGGATKKASATAKKAGSARKGAGSEGSGAWVSPNGSGEAPSTHPVKAKLASRLYRVPGMPMYDRTAPDRCYTSPEAAEADGFTRATR